MSKKDVQLWKDRKSVADKKYNKDVKDKLDRWRKYYRGQQWDNTSSQGYNNLPVDNMVFSNIKTIMPAINFNNPRIFVQAKKKPYRTKDGMIFNTIASSILLEILLNYYYKLLRIKRQTDKCLLDALIGPWGVMQLGYTAETEKIKDNELLEVHELLKSDSPFAIRRSPEDFRVDPEAKDSQLEDAKWIGFKWVKTLEDVQDNPKYKNTDKLKTNVTLDLAQDKSTAMVEKTVIKNMEDFKRVEGWDIWDRKNKRLITLVDNHDKFLQDIDWPLDFGGGFPCETLYFNENPDELMPLSDVEIYQSSQDELNRMRSLHLDHVRRVSQRKYLAKEDALDTEEMRKLQNGPDGTVVVTRGGLDSVTPIQDAVVSQDLYMAVRMLKEDIREASRVPMFEKGMAQKFDTATEPMLMAQGLSVHRAERTGLLEDFIVRVVKKMAIILQQTLDTESIPLTMEQFPMAQQFVNSRLEKIIGEDGAKVLLPWLNVDKDSIQGDYDFAIEVGSTQPVNQEKRKQDAIMMKKLFAGDPYVDQHDLDRRIIEAFEQQEVEKLLKDPQAVQQQQMQGAQMQMQAEIAKDEPKRQADLAKTQIKSKTALLTTALKAGTGKGGK